MKHSRLLWHLMSLQKPRLTYTVDANCFRFCALHHIYAILFWWSGKWRAEKWLVAVIQFSVDIILRLIPQLGQTSWPLSLYSTKNTGPYRESKLSTCNGCLPAKSLFICTSIFNHHVKYGRLLIKTAMLTAQKCFRSSCWMRRALTPTLLPVLLLSRA